MLLVPVRSKTRLLGLDRVLTGDWLGGLAAQKRDAEHECRHPESQKSFFHDSLLDLR